jgi:hypothetical protein
VSATIAVNGTIILSDGCTQTIIPDASTFHATSGEMKSVLQPWQLLLLILAGWINRHQQKVIEYLQVENQILREKLGKRRILLSDNQRRRLAIKGKVGSRGAAGNHYHRSP